MRRAVEHDVKREQRYGDDTEEREAVGRVEHEAERGDADERRRGRNGFRQAAEEEAYRLDENDAEAEGDEQLILVRSE